MLPLLALGGLFVGGQVASAVEARKSRKAAERANEIDRKIQLRAQRRERAAMLRESAVQRAMMLASAANTGTEGSSGSLGQQASMQSILTSNLAFSYTSQSAADQAFGYRRKAGRAESRSNLYSQVSNVALTAFSVGANMGYFGK